MFPIDELLNTGNELERCDNNPFTHYQIPLTLVYANNRRNAYCVSADLLIWSRIELTHSLRR